MRPVSAQVSKNEEKRSHEFFCKLMAYMNEYKLNITYDSSGLINLNAKESEDDVLEKIRTEKY